MHLYDFAFTPGTTPLLTTTNTTYDLGSYIAQGDDYNQRFGNHVDFQRFKMRCSIYPGTTAVTPSTVRMIIFRAAAGTAATYALNTCYNPILGSGVIQLLYDKMIQVPAATANNYFPVLWNINLKIKHRQKYSGPAASTQVGDSILFQFFSDKAAGTTAPTVQGNWELYFKP